MTKSRFEDLPNELFFHYQIYLTSNDLFKSFFNLNLRYNKLLLSLNNLFYEVDSTVHQQTIETKLYTSQITKLLITENSKAVSVSNVFTEMQSLVLYRPIRLNHQLIICFQLYFPMNLFVYQH